MSNHILQLVSIGIKLVSSSFAMCSHVAAGINWYHQVFLCAGIYHLVSIGIINFFYVQAYSSWYLWVSSSFAMCMHVAAGINRYHQALICACIEQLV